MVTADFRLLTRHSRLMFFSMPSVSSVLLIFLAFGFLCVSVTLWWIASFRLLVS
jgi:hypothetical protein